MSEGTSRLNDPHPDEPRPGLSIGLPLCARVRLRAAAGNLKTLLPMAATAGIVFEAGVAQAAGDLVLIPDLKLLLTMVVAFALLIFPLNALLFKPIFRALDARAERIQGARDRSAQLQADADQVLERYEAAIREARAESEIARQAKLESAREEQARLTAAARSNAEGELERARAELARTVGDARETLRASAEDLARSAAESVLGRAL